MSVIAWEHSCYGQTYNTPNFVPKYKLYSEYGLEGGIYGDLPYWDVPKDTEGLTVLAPVPAFRSPDDSKVRVFAHYFDKAGNLKEGHNEGSIDTLKARFGAPTGTYRAQMQSSLRTVMVFPSEGDPYFLKFAGDRYVKTTSSKDLTEKAVTTSFLRGKRLESNPNLLGDSSGILWPDSRKVPAAGPATLSYLANGTHHIAFRPFHLSIYKGAWKPNDHVLALHVLLSKEFGESTLGKKVTGSTPTARQEWVRQKFLPMLAKFIVDSGFRQGVHFEIHAQNIDLLVDGDTGEIKHFFVKDTLDALEDPLVKLVNGFEGEKLKGVRNLGWMNEVGLELKSGAAPHHLTGWYWAWFFQKTFGLFGNKDFPNTQKAFDSAPLNLWLGESLKVEFRKLLSERGIPTEQLKRGASWNRLANSAEADVQDLLTSLHYLFIEWHFSKGPQRFRKSSASEANTIRARLAEARREIVSTAPKGQFNLDAPGTAFGTFRGFPAAVRYGTGERIERVDLFFAGHDVNLCDLCIDSFDEIDDGARVVDPGAD
ncbi:MAG: hypothetical protein IOD12_18340 [Silvanigrellales bacterium]|nr:hypothetical protein [Silvanigrellales bacterium]